MHNTSKLKVATMALALSACSYQVMSEAGHNANGQKAHSTEGMQTVQSCSYAPLWLNPVNKDYANVDKIKADNNMKSVHNVKHVVYPYVLYTKSCMVVEGK